MRKISCLFLLCGFLSFSYAQNIDPIDSEILVTEVSFEGGEEASSDDFTSISEPETPDSLFTFIPTSSYLISDDPIVAALDDLNRQKYLETCTFTADRNTLNVYNYRIDEIPSFCDSIYEARINQLNLHTPMEITYNSIVKGYIDLYAVKKRELTAKVLGLSEVYFPMFEEMLDKYDVPLEMKYLAIVESALNPVATSRAGAKGLWQFMYGTGKMYGLTNTSIIDDRCDPYKSTDAACRHLKDLYNMYGNWELALAAYNCGAGNVNKAIRRSGGKMNYWQLWPYLPRETRGYVPAFIAVTYVMNYASEHNIYPMQPVVLAHEIDTVHVTNVLCFDQISEYFNIPLDLIEFLNPAYKKGIIPASSGNSYALRLPNQYSGLFLTNEDSLYAYKTKKGLEQERLMAEIKKVEKSDMIYHKVKKGETLGAIANKYRCTVNSLKTWNGLKTTNLKIGQQLVVYPSGSSPKSSTPVESTSFISKHTVNRGESLGSIAAKYGCSVANLQKWNNISGTIINTGQVLHVKDPNKVTAVASTTTTSSSSQDVYKVKSGDSLWSISQKYPGVSADDIKHHNGLHSNNLKIGQSLKIPKK